MWSFLRIVTRKEINNDMFVNNMQRAPKNGNALNGGAKIGSVRGIVAQYCHFSKFKILFLIFE